MANSKSRAEKRGLDSDSAPRLVIIQEDQSVNQTMQTKCLSKTPIRMLTLDRRCPLTQMVGSDRPLK